MSSARTAIPIVLAMVLVAGCGGGTESSDASDSPSPSESASASPAGDSASATPTESAAALPELEVVIQESFQKGPGVFATGEAKAYSVTAAEGALELFVGGLGDGDPNSVFTPAALPAPASAVRMKGTAEFKMTYGLGIGGYGLQCRAGDALYTLFLSETSGAGETDVATSVAIFRSEGGETQILQETPTTGQIGDANGFDMDGTCFQTESGATELSLSLRGEEVVSYTDEQGLGPFDSVALYGQWKGEKIPGNDFNAAGGGLTFAFDDVEVATGS